MVVQVLTPGVPYRHHPQLCPQILGVRRHLAERAAGRLEPPSVNHGRVPTVLSPEEVRRFLDAVEGGDGLFRLKVRLLYGTGLRRQEGCQVRVQDLDLMRHQLTVRHGKGGKDRVVMLPRSLEPDLNHQLAQRRQWHQEDLAAGQAYAPLPFALAKKYLRAAQEFGWHYVFAARQRSPDPKTGHVGRYHVNPGMLAWTVGAAARPAGLPRRLSHPAPQFRHAPGGTRR